jgi:hypothetical protein
MGESLVHKETCHENTLFTFSPSGSDGPKRLLISMVFRSISVKIWAAPRRRL